MPEINKGDVLKAKKAIVDINMRELIGAGEVVKCVGFSAPIAGELYTIDVQHFGKEETTTIRIEKADFANFEAIR